MNKKVIIFDFDGTIVDSSPGIMHAVKMMAERHKHPLPSQASIEAVISKGSTAILKTTFGDTLDEAKIKSLIPDFFSLYQRYGIFENQLYPGMATTLDTLNAHQIRWAIMTNGRSPVVNAMLSHLKLAGQPASVVCADQIPHRKPAPDGLLKVCAELKCSTSNCSYVGDAITDIQAGKAAGMHTIAALYGYVPAENPADTWGADNTIGAPEDLLDLLHLLKTN